MASIQKRVTVLWNRQVSTTCFRLGFSFAMGFDRVTPGQFVMLHLGERHASLLRRPFSIFNLIGSDHRPEGIEVLYKVVGKGTARMSSLKRGDAIDVIGPLGHGFRIRAEGPYYLTAGGIGVAPIHLLARFLTFKGIDLAQCRMFLGGQTREDLLCEEAFTEMGMPLTVTTDDGSSGDQCLITDPLEVAVTEQRPLSIFACGPQGMLECVAGIAARQNVACQVSMETTMACGMGACLGCAVESSHPEKGYLHTCVHGPVFEAEQLNWDALSRRHH